MDEQQQPLINQADPAAPAPPAEKPKWTVRRTAIAAIAATAIVATGGVALAATNNSESSAAAAGNGGGPGGGNGGGMRGSAFGGSGLMNALHGEFVMADSDNSGSYVTRLMQTGEVTAVTASSITVKSTDGYTVTYTIGSSTTVDNGDDEVSDIETGHTVTVIASTEKTAVTITDSDLASAGGGLPGGGQPPSDGGS